MLSIESQESRSFKELTSLQFGWDFRVSQLGPAEKKSWSCLYSTPNTGINQFHYGVAYDQRLHSRAGFMSFGLLDSDNPATFTYDQLIPNDAITVFPEDECIKASSPVGFRGSGIHFSRRYLAQLADQVFHRPLDFLVPEVGMYLPDASKLTAVRAELAKWQQLESAGVTSNSAIIPRREESLAIALLDAVCDGESIDKDHLLRSEYALTRALDYIHDSELENISAAELCNQAGCSQRMLEKSFLRRFGVTPKKYIKRLRLARVHAGLQSFSSQDCASIIELAGINGFWHMGQFAADYRQVYGELPSETLSRS